MSLVTDTLDGFVADLEAQVAAPTGDLGFGSDISCTTDITATLDEVSGDSSLAVAQAAYRRLATPRGGLIDDDDYGLDVRRYLGRPMTAQEVQAITGEIRNELLKDDRIDSVDEVSLVEASGQTFDLTVRCTTAAGPFRLTLAVADADTLIKEMSA